MPRRRRPGTSRLPKSPTHRQIVSRAMAGGALRAEALLAARARRARAKGPTTRQGVLVAEGDSWFDYPLVDILEALEDRGYQVEAVAHRGDTLESMAYDTAQLEALDRLLFRLRQQGQPPRALLLSAGGNDIAGDEFAVLLNHAASGLPPLNAKLVDGIVNERLRAAVAWVISAATRFCREYFDREVPIVVHGYGYPVPDGRGVLGGFWLLPGPWLKPGFQQKGYVTRPGDADLEANAATLKPLIDTFNAMLASLRNQTGMGHVSYLDLRPALDSTVAGRAYRRSWANELHPTGKAFTDVARRFHDRVQTFPRP